MSIVDPSDPLGARRQRAWLWLVASLTLAVGLAATWHYLQAGLTLSHYDAKAHLVVARRIFDSLTPGWRQIGAVWLPLPHLLNAIPVQVDAFYRTGASGIAISTVSFVVASTALARLVLQGTGSRSAALAAAVVFASDPNVLYLQATPMTEPLLLGLITLSTTLACDWVVRGGTGWPRAAGPVLAAACLTRYEAWPVAAALVGLCAVAFAWGGRRAGAAVASAARLAVYPALAVVAFLCLSRATVGEWFVTGGFYVADNKALGKPLVATAAVWWGLRHVVGNVTLGLGVAGALACLAVVARHRARAPLLLTGALLACAALPWYAFLSGHPFRIRYMVVLVAAVAACAGLGAGLVPRRWRTAASALVACVAIVETPPLSARAPMVEEAQWDVPNSRARRAVTACLAREFDRPRDKVLASMGSLAHYMQETSQVGFALDDYIHEGVGELWPAAIDSPRRHVRWILFEEHAEGGDMLTALRSQDVTFAEGFDRVCEGGGVALYRRAR